MVNPLEVMLGFVALAAVGVIPWPDLVGRRQLGAVLPIAAILIVLPVELLPAWDMHYEVVLALPLLWAALSGERRVVAAGLAAIVVVCAFPSLLYRTVPMTLLFDAVTIAVSAFAAFTVAAVVARVRRRERALALAFTDTLTGLPNRQAWDSVLATMLAPKLDLQGPMSVAIIDLDAFGDYNEDWGHQAGDRLLRAVATAWRSALRDIDVLARYGDDEFALAIPRCGLEQVEAVVARLSAVSPPGVTFAAGVVHWDGTEGADDVMRGALASLERAKRSPRTAAQPRTVAGTSHADTWDAIVPDLVTRQAIESVYQPIVRLADLAVTAYEALARPRGTSAQLQVDGMFSTARRLALSAELELICLRAAVRGAGSLPSAVDLFINIAAGSLRDPGMVMAELEGLLAEAGRNRASVVLEVSEALTRVSRFIGAFEEFRSAGYRFALDDVGEGNSAIESLVVVQPAFVKLGRSLVMTRATPGSAAVIHALIEYAHFTGAEVIAEGVEQADDCAPLAELGVTYGQGYGLGRPQRMERDEQQSVA